MALFLKNLTSPSCEPHCSLHLKPANILVVRGGAVKLTNSEADHLRRTYVLGPPTEKPAWWFITTPRTVFPQRLLPEQTVATEGEESRAHTCWLLPTFRALQHSHLHREVCDQERAGRTPLSPSAHSCWADLSPSSGALKISTKTFYQEYFKPQMAFPTPTSCWPFFFLYILFLPPYIVRSHFNILLKKKKIQANKTRLKKKKYILPPPSPWAFLTLECHLLVCVFI